MTCARIRKVILQSDVRRLPTDVLEHARQCPRCGLVLQRTRMVCGLIHLKSYEQPAPGADGRCLAEVRDRIAISQSWQEQGRGAEGAGLGFGWRFSFAAAFVALIGINVITSTRLPSLQPMAREAAPPADLQFADTVYTNMLETDAIDFDRWLASRQMHRVPETGGLFRQPRAPGPDDTLYQPGVPGPGGSLYQPRVPRPDGVYYNVGLQER